MPQRKVRREDKARFVRRPKDRQLVQRNESFTPGEGLKAAVQAALILGIPSQQIAQQYGLKPSLVQRWEQAFDITSPLKRRDSLSESLLAFVQQELLALTAISIATMDEDWVKDQKAGELAQFVSAKQDRLMEILSAYGRTQVSHQQIEADSDSGD